MPEMIIRPTMKFIYIGYTVVILIAIAAIAVMREIPWPAWMPQWLQSWIPWSPVLLLLWPLNYHMRNHLTRMTILDDRLRYETGLLDKTTRTILISRVQDLTVHQRASQQVFGVGDLSIETAGETSRLTISDIDRPQEIADYINELSRREPSKNNASDVNDAERRKGRN